jgi:hypothetical protein
LESLRIPYRAVSKRAIGKIMGGWTSHVARYAFLVSCAAAPAIAALPVPRPGPLQTYKDWTVGCDNGGRCEAISLMPENADWSRGIINVSITRDPGPDAPVEVWLRHADGELGGAVSVYVDGGKVASARIASDEAKIEGPQASALAIGAARGNSMEIRQGTKTLARLSLSGASAALRYMDAQQGRANTITALVASGTLGPGAVRPGATLPAIRRVAIPEKLKAAPLWREELTRAGTASGCSREVDGTREAEQYPLNRTQTLVLVPCGSGAYNFSSVPMIATGVVGRRTFTPARFDFQPGWSENPGTPMLVNASWEAATSQLSSYAKGRGIGDCGGSETYVWDGNLFRLVEAKAMGECRGAWHWITTWRASIFE